MLRSIFLHIIYMCVCLIVPVAAWGAEPFVVVLDAGHGGHDPGTIGRKAKEKDINLGVVLKLGGLIEKNDKDVKVVYTRKGDYFKTCRSVPTLQTMPKGHSSYLSMSTLSTRKPATALPYTVPPHIPSDYTAALKTSRWPSARMPL